MSFHKYIAFPFLRRCTTVTDAQQKREARLSHRREPERRLRALESAEQREARSAKRRVRNRARRATQSTVQYERDLQQRRERFTDETTENREASLEKMRQRIT